MRGYTGGVNVSPVAVEVACRGAPRGRHRERPARGRTAAGDPGCRLDSSHTRGQNPAPISPRRADHRSAGRLTGELATLKVWKALLRERGETFL